MNPSSQIPAPGQVFLDHVGWFVADLSAAGNAFERLGFRLTPYTEHRNATEEAGSVPSGTANRCAMLEHGYLELLAAVRATSTVLACQLRAALARYEGVHLIAFAAGDIDVERARLAEAGFEPQPVVDLRRPIECEDGSEKMAAFSVVRVPPDRMPEGRIQFVAHRTPALVWQPGSTAHENAIDALTGILVVVADSAGTAARYAGFTGGKPRAVRDGVAAIVLERGRIAFIDANSRRARGGSANPSPPFMGAIALRSRDLAATRAYLARQRIRLVADADDHLIVDPQDAAGAELIIHADGADDCLYGR